MPGERIINSYVLYAAGERFSVSLSTVEFLPDGTGTLMRVTEHGAYFDGYPEGLKNAGPRNRRAAGTAGPGVANSPTLKL